MNNCNKFCKFLFSIPFPPLVPMFHAYRAHLMYVSTSLEMSNFLA